MKWHWPWQNPWGLYCLSGEHGEFLWKRSFPVSTRAPFNSTSGLGIIPSNSVIRALDADSERIVVGMDRVTAVGVGPIAVGTAATRRQYADFNKCYGVACLNQDGKELWRADVGAVVWDVEIIPGVGVVVVHDNSHHIDDPLTISINGVASGNFVVTDDAMTLAALTSETGGRTSGNVATQTATGAMALYRMTALAPQMIALAPGSPVFNRWDTDVEIAGGPIAPAGFQFKFSSRLGGPTGYRPVAFCRYPSGGSEVGSPATHAVYACASLANVTLLNIESGAVIWRQNVFTSGALRPDNTWAPRGVSSDRAGNIYVFRPRLPNSGIADGVTTLDYTGAIVNQISFSTSVNIIDGTDFIVVGGFVFVRGSKFSLGTGAFVSAFPSQPYWFDHATGLLWANGTPVDPASGLQIPPVFNGGSGARLTSDGYVVAPGGADPMGFYASGLRKWRYLDTGRDDDTKAITTLGAACGKRYVFAARRVVEDPNASLGYTEFWEDFDGYYG